MQQQTCTGNFFSRPDHHAATQTSAAIDRTRNTAFTKIKCILQLPILTLERHWSQVANQGRCDQKQAINLIKLPFDQ
jgi:hypothetical protein